MKRPGKMLLRSTRLAYDKVQLTVCSKWKEHETRLPCLKLDQTAITTAKLWSSLFSALYLAHSSNIYWIIVWMTVPWMIFPRDLSLFVFCEMWLVLLLTEIHTSLIAWVINANVFDCISRILITSTSRAEACIEIYEIENGAPQFHSSIFWHAHCPIE